MSSLNPDAKKIQQVIQGFDKQIKEMHLKVHRYLSDRSKNPHPRHEEFIQRIFNYQIKGTGNRTLELMLDNVQHKASSRARIWKQWFENDAKGLFRKGNVDGVYKGPKTKNIALMDKIYERTKKAWAKYGVTDIELKKDFAERILPAYNNARRNLKNGQKVAFVYDKNTHRVLLKIKEK